MGVLYVSFGSKVRHRPFRYLVLYSAGSGVNKCVLSASCFVWI